MQRMTGGKAVVESLKREGVEFVFGVPGVQIMHIFDAFYGEPEIRLLTVRHEQTAIYMADGYSRVRGKPGVGLVVPGPGVQNASAALGTAYACSSPVLSSPVRSRATTWDKTKELSTRSMTSWTSSGRSQSGAGGL